MLPVASQQVLKPFFVASDFSIPAPESRSGICTTTLRCSNDHQCPLSLLYTPLRCCSHRPVVIIPWLTVSSTMATSPGVCQAFHHKNAGRAFPPQPRWVHSNCGLLLFFQAGNQPRIVQLDKKPSNARSFIRVEWSSRLSCLRRSGDDGHCHSVNSLNRFRFHTPARDE